MITDARVLQPEFVPRDVRHRGAEVSHLTDTLHPIISDEGHPQSSFLYGPSGAGKTCIARYTVEQLREEVVDVDTQYVNCWEDYTRFKTLYRLLDGINQAYNIHRQSTPRDELLERLKTNIDTHYVVILDEVDQLHDKRLLYDLYRIPNLTMILVANSEEDVFGMLDQRVVSRLKNCARIRFNRYSKTELEAILTDRVNWGLTPDAITNQEISMMADRAAGDARSAIGILRNTTQLAQQRGLDTVSIDLIDQAVSETHSEIQQRTTDKLTHHQQVLYDIIVESGEIGGGELYQQYRQSVTDPKTRRTMRNYLQKLEQYNLIEAHGTTKARTYTSQNYYSQRVSETPH
ncbi:Cdc6/Cdc18 family protein [Methanonatronarchaeum sp. AMET6-2]|uniref:Cdc6/Cdc18 family protein n=1 Tax=Methanonatronarchaeum sp. AMET6-2 TaxID=2933293 RepID=UPI0021119867|nr:Cdc6/Cdc18 family protein [Methanonatronarchaeum sp. AMET6-2]